MAELAFCWVRVVHFTVGYFGFTENAFTYDVLLCALYRMNPSMGHAGEVSAQLDRKEARAVASLPTDLRLIGGTYTAIEGMEQQPLLSDQD